MLQLAATIKCAYHGEKHATELHSEMRFPLFPWMLRLKVEKLQEV